MVFTPPAWVPKLPFDPPDSISIPEFLFNEKLGRHPLALSRAPFTCGITGETYSALDVRDRVEKLARALSAELGWEPNNGSEWDKIDTLTLNWATHRLSGISSPANAAYSADELEHQLKVSKATALFTCLPLLATALEAARSVCIPTDRIYLLDVPSTLTPNKIPPGEFKTVNQLITLGATLPPLPALDWSPGQGARQCAFLCFSSGTSGLPKGVMISHRNVIANTLQITTFDRPARRPETTEVILGLLPQSHIYSLVVCCHASIYRGDGVINLPKFELPMFLSAISRFKINILYLVPPIIIAMANNAEALAKHDLSSISAIFTGAAPLGAETAETLQKQHPSWKIRQGYGLTETSTVVCSTSVDDVWFGSCGSLLPAVEARIVSMEGNDITGYDQPGELLLRSPSVVLGYLNNDAANRDTFQNGWIRTGDEAVVRKHPESGNEHIFVVDRIKELIKVKGMQVPPAELEALLLTHPSVLDCAVIPTPSATAGEYPKAFVVKSKAIGLEEGEVMLARRLMRFVEKSKARHKWIRGGVEFVDVIPKSTSGKILRRLLRDKERERIRREGSKL